jgi:hypothetical protein
MKVEEGPVSAVSLREEEETKAEDLTKPTEETQPTIVLKNTKYLKMRDINQECYLLEIISSCSPKMLRDISVLKLTSDSDINPDQLKWVGNCFMELVNLIIYERTELYHGWDQLQRYCSHSYDAYQHFLILKSCADLQKFNVDAVSLLDQKYLRPLNEA